MLNLVLRFFCLLFVNRLVLFLDLLDEVFADGLDFVCLDDKLIVGVFSDFALILQMAF